MNRDVREAIIRSQIVTSDSDKVDEHIKNKIHQSNIQKRNFVYPYFKVEFETYDPFPSESCVQELQNGIEETIFKGDSLPKIVNEYDPIDVIETKPHGEDETELVRVGESFVDPQGQSSMINIDLSVFEDILD